jgi:hypothetical protein
VRAMSPLPSRSSGDRSELKHSEKPPGRLVLPGGFSCRGGPRGRKSDWHNGSSRRNVAGAAAQDHPVLLVVRLALHLHLAFAVAPATYKAATVSAGGAGRPNSPRHPIGIAPSNLSAIARGRTQPCVTIVVRIAELSGKSIGWLLKKSRRARDNTAIQSGPGPLTRCDHHMKSYSGSP